MKQNYTLSQLNKKNSQNPNTIQKRKGELNSKKRLTYIITHEEIIGIGCTPSNPKQLDEIVELTMNIAADGDGALHRLHVPLLHQNRPCLIAQRLHLRLRQRLALHQLLDLTLQIRVRRHRFVPSSEITPSGFSSSLRSIRPSETVKSIGFFGFGRLARKASTATGGMPGIGLGFGEWNAAFRSWRGWIWSLKFAVAPFLFFFVS